MKLMKWMDENKKQIGDVEKALGGKVTKSAIGKARSGKASVEVIAILHNYTKGEVTFQDFATTKIKAFSAESIKNTQKKRAEKLKKETAKAKAVKKTAPKKKAAPKKKPAKKVSNGQSGKDKA